MKNGSAKAKCLFLLGGLCIVALFAFLGLTSKPAAAVANNQTINFQGRLLNSQGAAVTDGFYNIQFKVYQDGDGQSAGDTTGSPAGTLKWTENWLNSGSHGVKVVNGFMSVQLGSVTAFGSNIDWNQGNLWLSMNVGDTSSCTITTNFTANCNGDGEMLPMQPLTASPYSLNSGELNGLTSNNFVQLAQGIQTDASTNVSLGINKTGASGNILELQKGGVDVMNVSNTGTVLFQPSADSATALQVENHANGYSVFTVDTSGNAVILGKASSLTGKLQFATAGGGTLTLSPTSSASSFTITFPGETGTVCTTAASGVCNTAGGLSNVAYLNQNQTFTGTNTFAPTTNITSAIVKQTSASSPSADIFDIQGTNGTSNFLQVTSTAANQGAITVQSFGSNDVTLNSGSGTVKLGSGTTAVQFTNSGTATVDATSGQELDLGAAANAHTTKLGSTSGGATTTIQSGTGGININPNGGSNTGVIVKPANDSTAGFQVQNAANSKSVFDVDTSNGQVILGTGGASGVSGQIKFNYTGQTGSITLAPANPSSTAYTITIPAETGTLCTTAASAACTAVYATTSGTVLLGPASVQADASNNNSIFINKTSGTGNILELQKSAADVFKVDNTGNVTSTGQNTLSRNSSGANDYSLGVTGTTSPTGSSSLVRIGSALTAGNGAANGGTYLSIVEPGSGAGSAADFLNLQNGSTVELQLSSAGALTVGGTYNGNTFDNAGHLTFGNSGAAVINSNGANNLTIDTGSAAAILALGNTAATTNIGTSNAVHTIGIGTGGGGTNTEAVTIGAATNSSSTVTLQGGSAGSSIVLQTGNNGTTAGAIQIGNTSGAFSQTISLGDNNNGANVVNLGTGTAQDNVTIGDNTNASSSVSLKAGSTGGISLGANTTLSANSNLTYASGTGKFDASNASGTFDTTTGTNHLNGATTVTGTNTFTVNGGLTTLNGVSAGSSTAAKINTNATSNNGLVVQAAASQVAPLFVLQDSGGATLLSTDASGDQEQLGYLDTPYGGIGSFGNLLVQSEQLGTTWTATGITVTQNDSGSNPPPDGNATNTADKLVASSSGTHTLTQTYSSAGNNTYTFSIWLKTNSGGDTVQLRIDSNGTPPSGTAKTFNLTTTWQRLSVTQAFTSGVTTVTPTVIMNNSSVLAGWGGQLVQGGTAGVYTRTGSSNMAASSGLIDNQNATFQASNNSTTAYQFQNASGVNVAAIDTTNGQVVLGSGSGSVSGQIKFNYTGQTGSITLAPANPSSTAYTITIPAETGTLCTTAASAACTAVYSTAGSYVNLAPSAVQADATSNNSIFINKTSGTGNILELQKSASDVFKVDNTGNVTSTGQNTLSRNSSGANDYSLGVTGTTSPTGSSSLVRIGSALTAGNGAANGGTYLSIVEPGSGAGSAADFLNLQNGSTVELQLSSAGALTVGGTYNGNTFDNAGHLTFGNSGAAVINSNGANNLTIDTGSAAAILALGNTAATTNIGTSNAVHTIGIGTGGGGTNTEAVTIGAATNSSSTLTLQGGNGGSAISLLTGINGAGTLGGIQIGNGSSANSQTISIGSSNTNASGTNVVSVGTAATATDSVTIGSTSNSSSSVAINGGSTGGITLTANTTNINSGTVATNQSTLAVFNSPTNVTTYQAGTTISIGATSGTLTVRNANQILGNAAGSGLFTNNGATLNTTLSLGDFPTGGSIGTNTATVDIYTSISIAQTTGSQALTIPSPTASTTYGRVIYLSNIGTASFTIGGIRIPPGDTATMMWSNTNGAASWQFAGAGASSIENQNTNDQTADFRINGTGRANTSFTSPVFDSISGSLGIGSVNATTINIGNSGGSPTTNVNITTKGAGTTIKTATDVTNAFQVQNNAGATILQVDSLNRQLKVYENGGSTNYALIYYDTATSTANYTASSGTVAVGTGAGAITVTAGSGAAVNITANAASTWKTTAGTLSLQSGTGSSDFLILNAGGSGQVQVNGSAVVKLGSASADPTCTTGAVYYNTTSNLFRGCQNGTWATLSSTTQTLQQGYTSSTGGTTPEIKIDTTRNGVDIQDADSTIGGVLFAVRGSNAGGLGTSLFNVSSSNNTVNIGASGTSTALLVLGLDTDSTYNQGTISNAATEVNGAMFYSASDHNFLCGTAGQWMTCNGLLYSNTTASSAVNTCTTACAAFSTNNSTMIPANYCQAGRVITIRARGHYSVLAATTPTLQMGVYYGTNTTTAGSDTQIGASTPAPASASGASNQFWALDYTITCFDTTHMLGEGTYTFQNNTTATTTMLSLNVLSTSSTSVTTTSAKSLYIFPTWSANSASNTATLDQLVVTGN